MNAFIHEVEHTKIYKGRFSPEVRATFEQHAPYKDFPLNVLFGNFTLFAPLIKKIMLGIPQARAMLSTSVSFTTFFAGSKEEPQIQAKEAEATLFLRCIREEELYHGLEEIKGIAAKHGV